MQGNVCKEYHYDIVIKSTKKLFLFTAFEYISDTFQPLIGTRTRKNTFLKSTEKTLHNEILPSFVQFSYKYAPIRIFFLYNHNG